MKFAYDFFVARKLLYLSGFPSVEPTIIPSCAFHSRGSPSHPSRFFPLNSGLKPSLPKAPMAPSNSVSNSFFLILLRPFDGYGAKLHVLGWPVLRAPRNLGNLFDDIITLHHFAEHGVFVIEPGRFHHR